MKRRKPSRVIERLQMEIDSAVGMLLNYSGLSLEESWRYFVVDQTRGRTYFHSATITVPLWAYMRGTDFFLYYVSHELAHAVGKHRDHSAAFMETFKQICPKELQHFETMYKPRNAKAAGIGKGV